VTLKLWRERRYEFEVAATLRLLADTNEWLSHPKESILQAKESLEIFERLNNVLEQAQSLQKLAQLLHHDNQLDAAEEAASRSIDLLPDSEQFLACQGHRALGDIHHSKGETEKAINHYETALGIATSSNWHDQQFWIHYALAGLSRDQSRFDDAHAHIDRAKSHAVNDAYNLGRAMELHAWIWYQQGGLGEAKSEALHAVDVYGKIGAVKDVEDCRKLLQKIEKVVDP
jgi:tetratricopeptide (TPR) repeat protein